MSELPLLALAALVAGFVDAVAGGGGLIQVPALFNALPAEAPATIFGTNKGSSIVGTANAAWRYARRIAIPWEVALPAAVSAFAFSFAGAATVAWLPKDVVRPLVLVMMVLVVVYTALKPDLGRGEEVSRAKSRTAPAALAVGAALGFYDGFFGPGAGSFMIFAFVTLFGLDFLRASSAAKVVNLATNGAALVFFIPSGHILWPIALAMAVFNAAGAFVGTRLALRHGSGFVRWVFLGLSTILIAKFGYDTVFAQIK
ncbi:MAG TPA: TSUP family transporter [Rhodocyclaceae bacterium]|nr:TSUP family transporter [Rhodocyclaceae bacterium]